MPDNMTVNGMDRFVNSYVRGSREGKPTAVEQAEKGSFASALAEKVAAKPAAANRDRIEIRKPQEQESFMTDTHERIRKDVVRKLQTTSDTAQLDAIRQQIQEGSYTIDPMQIAQRMLSSLY